MAQRKEGRGRHLDRLLSCLTLVLGLWLVVAPVILGHPDRVDRIDPWVIDVVVGIAVAVLSLARLAAPLPTPPLSLVIAVLGIWLIVTPFALVYAADGGWPAEKTNDIIVGVVLLVSATADWLVGAWRADPGGGPRRGDVVDPGPERRPR